MEIPNKDTKRGQAKKYFRHYIRELSKRWSDDHDKEIFLLVDLLIDAAKEELIEEFRLDITHNLILK